MRNWIRAATAAGALAGGAMAQADERAAEIARIHVEAIGGRARIEALRAMRLSGVAVTATRQVAVTLLAARPARLRAEMLLDGRTIVQATDGTEPPWQEDPRATPVVARLAPAAAERFLIDAEFDDPLVSWQERGRRIEFAGETAMGGRRLLRVLVVRSLTENVFVLLDPATHFIVLRVQELRAGAARVEVVTRYQDHRPVHGVLLPHDIAMFENGRMTQRLQFEAIAGNPLVADEVFRMPPK